MTTKKPEGKLIAVIRIKGEVKISKEIEDALEMLNLHKKNWCAVVEKSPCNLGMITKVKDFATWGDIDEATYKALVEKRGELFKGRETDSKDSIKYTKYVEVDNKKYKRYFRLSPPVGGFEKKGTKHQFRNGGALGDRKDKIKDLIERMI